MKLFDVYPRFPIEAVKGEGAHVWDSEGNEYLDFYGGHAVISIGHSHPHFVKRIEDQLGKMAFYSNSIQISIQEELASKLGEMSDYDEWQLFLCNSGAEANENALKLASAHNGRKEIIAFHGGFHGRTSLAVAVTDNPKIVYPVNEVDFIHRLNFNDYDAVKNLLETKKISSVIIEGIQGIGGIYSPDADFLIALRELCSETGTVLILDEIQSGFGRSGSFFAHQWAGIKADIVSMAKGMGNGFPVGGILISPEIEAKYGMLGSTFGGNHLACAATLAVLEVIEQENLMGNALEIGDYLLAHFDRMDKIKDVRGVGLMIGLEFDEPIKSLREKLLYDHKIFTGSSSNPNVLRLLPPLGISEVEADKFVAALDKELR